MADMAESTLKHLASFVLLPEMVLKKQFPLGRSGIGFEVEKNSTFEFCPTCQKKCVSVHSRHQAKIKDATLRGKIVILYVNKKRYRCKTCNKIFTEHFPGISPRKRHTHRYQREVKWASTNFSDMKKVQKFVRSSAATCFKTRNDELSKKVRETNYPLPEKLGIDEHSLRKPKYQATEYNSIIVDHKNKKVFDLLPSRSKLDLVRAFEKYEGKENVKWVSMDFSTTFKSVVRSCLANAKIVLDRFHVQRLFGRLVNRMRKKITGDKRKNPIRKLLLRNESDLDPTERRVVRYWLNQQPQVKEVYEYKEAMRRVYKSKGIAMATRVLNNLLEKMKSSKNELVLSLRKTIVTWKNEILNYHLQRISNGRTEGFNRKAKLIQRRAYGLKNFKNYRLCLLNECR
jgi:transposase